MLVRGTEKGPWGLARLIKSEVAFPSAVIRYGRTREAAAGPDDYEIERLEVSVLRLFLSFLVLLS